MEPQLGDLYDMMQYHGHEMDMFFNANYNVNEKLSFFAEFSYLKSNEVMDHIDIDLSQVNNQSFTHVLFDPMALEYLGEYSRLDIEQIIEKYGVRYSLNDNWYVSGTLYHYKYDDNHPYILDGTGEIVGFIGGVGYKF